MADESQCSNFNIDFVTPVERVLQFAEKSLASTDEYLRAIAKAVLDVTTEASKIQAAITADGNVDLETVFKFDVKLDSREGEAPAELFSSSFFHLTAQQELRPPNLKTVS